LDNWTLRWHRITSIAICACAMILGTLLYPVILLFFTAIAAVYPLLRWREPPVKPARGAPTEGGSA